MGGNEAVTVVIWEDRHSGTTVYLFTDPGVAVEWAWEQAHRIVRNGRVAQKVYSDGEIWIDYGVENDHLRVIPAVRVDAELEEAA